MTKIFFFSSLASNSLYNNDLSVFHINILANLLDGGFLGVFMFLKDEKIQQYPIYWKDRKIDNLSNEPYLLHQ